MIVSYTSNYPFFIGVHDLRFPSSTLSLYRFYHEIKFLLMLYHTYVYLRSSYICYNFPKRDSLPYCKNKMKHMKRHTK